MFTNKIAESTTKIIKFERKSKINSFFKTMNFILDLTEALKKLNDYFHD